MVVIGAYLVWNGRFGGSFCGQCDYFYCFCGHLFWFQIYECSCCMDNMVRYKVLIIYQHLVMQMTIDLLAKQDKGNNLGLGLENLEGIWSEVLMSYTETTFG